MRQYQKGYTTHHEVLTIVIEDNLEQEMQFDKYITEKLFSC